MGAIQRPFDRGTRLGRNKLKELGEEFRHQRLRLGLSQKEVAEAARIDRADYCRIELANLERLSIVLTNQVAAVLGLDLWARLYPGGEPIADAGQAVRLAKVLEAVGAPLRYRTEVGLPSLEGRTELRAWDAVIYGHGARTGIECEARLYDAQAQQRRWNLKRRDDPVDNFLLIVADTSANRRALREHAELFADLPRLRTANVLKMLRNGQHPPTGMILV